MTDNKSKESQKEHDEANPDHAGGTLESREGKRATDGANGEAAGEPAADDPFDSQGWQRKLGELREVASMHKDGPQSQLRCRTYPVECLQAIADRADEPERDEWLSLASGRAESFRRKLPPVDSSDPDVVLLCALEAFGLSPSEARSWLGGIPEPKPTRDEVFRFIIERCDVLPAEGVVAAFIPPSSIAARIIHEGYLAWRRDVGKRPEQSPPRRDPIEDVHTFVRAIVGLHIGVRARYAGTEENREIVLDGIRLRQEMPPAPQR